MDIESQSLETAVHVEEESKDVSKKFKKRRRYKKKKGDQGKADGNPKAPLKTEPILDKTMLTTTPNGRKLNKNLPEEIADWTIEDLLKKPFGLESGIYIVSVTPFIFLKIVSFLCCFVTCSSKDRKSGIHFGEKSQPNGWRKIEAHG